MARTKQSTPLQCAPSDFNQGPPESPSHGWKESNGSSKATDSASANGSISRALEPVASQPGAGLPQLIVCVGGIYISLYDTTTPPFNLKAHLANPLLLLLRSLTWALLQERITTTTYGAPSAPQRFTFSIVLNTLQSLFAALTGTLYLSLSSRGPSPAIFPSRALLGPLLLVALTSSLASPFGYAALAHIDYVTFILAKACKLLPVMFLHVTLFRRPYPLYKYGVVALVTAGVAVFTLGHPTSSKKTHSPAGAPAAERHNAWGLLLLSINLLLDGLTNATQDHIFTTHRPYSGPQMMAAQNILATALTTTYLLLLPLLPPALLTALAIPAAAPRELPDALAFLAAHPAVLADVLAFAACGAVGQIFIYMTLAQFSSLLLVTVTVTRKMLTMLLSVLWFGHRLGRGQWLGVGLVFGGVGAEAWVARREKKAKEGRGRKRD
ncbi:UDP-galactose transporter [Xylographa opegraphella]|nr:UDP-galactose transporter [Xylographa opegraphella]